MSATLEGVCPRGEMDITTVFGTVVPGSSPGEGTDRVKIGWKT